MKKNYTLAVLLTASLLSACGQTQDMRINELQIQIAANESRISGLQDTIAQLESRIEVLETEKNEESSNSTDLSEAATQAADTIQNYENVSEQDCYGVWVSCATDSDRFTLLEDGKAILGDMECRWKLDSGSYGPYGITLYVDDGAGSYDFLFYNSDPLTIRGNGRTTLMPEYLSSKGFDGIEFRKE